MEGLYRVQSGRSGLRRKALVVIATTVSALTAGLAGAPAAAAATATLPDMQMLVPTNAISIGIDPATSHRMLRYAHITSDLGTGPFELDPTYDPATGTATFTQAIYNSPSAGVWSLDHRVPVSAIGVFNAPSDYQFPLTSFALYHVDGTGALGAVAATSPKTDYCITGDTRVPGVPNTPSQSSPPVSNCENPSKPLGWSVGWGDEYDATDPGQPIDLTGVPDGTYVLRGIVDPRHVLTESDATNNVTDTVLAISGNSVTVGAQTHPGLGLPTVSLTSPAAGSQATGTVTLTASASATAPATVASVQFLLDGQPLGAPVTTAPYTFDWTVGSTPAGTHDLSARVVDSSGAMNTASDVPVSVPSQGGGGGGSLVFDAQVSQTGSTSVTSPAFNTTVPGDLLLAFVGTDGSAGQTATVSGAGLTWTLAKRANGQPGDAEIWRAIAPTPLSGVAVTSTAARSGFDQQLTVVAIEGAGGVGATASASSATQASSASYLATAAGSLGFAVGNDFDRAAARTLGSGQSLLSQFVDTRTRDTYWTQDTTSTAAAVGSSVTLNDTAPTGDHTNLAVVEVTPSGVTPPPPPPDTTPPTVSITNPTNAQTVSATIPLAANAADNVAVSSVHFLVDGQPFGSAVTSPPYAVTLDTTTLTAGVHTIAATAIDSSGNTTTSLPVSVTVTNPPPPMACFVRQAQVSVHGKGTVTTASFGTAVPDEVLLALVSSDGPKTAGGQSVTVSGGGLTWKRVAGANARFGDAEVWTANVAAITPAITVRSTPAKGGYDQDLTVVAMEGATGTGASTAVSAASGAPTASVTTTGPASSLVFAVGNDWDRAVARTLPTGQVFTEQFLDTGTGDTFWSQNINASVAGGVKVTMTDTAPTTDEWNLVAVELVGEIS